MSDLVATREHILDQAQGLFRRFSYGKTTMADIAGAVSMSAANLYRYFDAKEEIAIQVSQRCLYEDEDIGREIIRSAEPSATVKLERLIREISLHKYDRFQDDPYMQEIIQICATNRRETMDTHMASCTAMIQEVLDLGLASGEFEPVDGDNDAFKVLLALAGAWYPAVSMMFSREQIDAYCGQLTKLVLKGLLSRSPAA
jgi:AcrR family transcriptional regulator